MKWNDSDLTLSASSFSYLYKLPVSPCFSSFSLRLFSFFSCRVQKAIEKKDATLEALQKDNTRLKEQCLKLDAIVKQQRKDYVKKWYYLSDIWDI